jgi:hypothetical protein
MDQIQEMEVLHALSRRECTGYLDSILEIVKRNLDGPLFSHDAALVADPLYFACVMIAETGGREEDFNLCLNALQRSQWTYTRAGDRLHKLMAIWDERLDRSVGGMLSSASSPASENVLGVSGKLDNAGSPIVFTDVHGTPSSSYDSPVLPASDSAHFFPPSARDFGIPAPMVVGEDVMKVDQLLANFDVPAKPTSGAAPFRLPSAFPLRPVSEFVDHDGPGVTSRGMDHDRGTTPRSEQLYEAYTNADYFLQ